MRNDIRKRIYEASPRHCEPMTAQNPGVKCPPWSVADAQKMLDEAQPIGQALQATKNGIGFVARITRRTDDTEIWHGYPEAWDRMDVELKRRWLDAGVIRRQFKTREQVRDAFGGRLVDDR